MAHQLRQSDGSVIPATIELGDGSVTLHSRGGATGGRPERNPGYSAAFDAIIDRLRPQERLISRVLLDSRRARASGDDVVLVVASDFARYPLEEVKLRIRRSARDYGRAADAAPNQGNSTKRLRFEVNLGAAELARRLAAIDPVGNAGLEPPNDGHADREVTLPQSDDDQSWAEGDRRKVSHLRRVCRAVTKPATGAPALC
jgi:hypothetical protein